MVSKGCQARGSWTRFSQAQRAGPGLSNSHRTADPGPTLVYASHSPAEAQTLKLAAQPLCLYLCPLFLSWLALMMGPAKPDCCLLVARSLTSLSLWFPSQSAHTSLVARSR